jgi:peroxiredoxin
MHDVHDKFTDLGATVVVIVKDDKQQMLEYWAENALPFTGIPDPQGVLGDLYKQESKFGLMPALFVIDKEGVIRFVHYGTGMKDIPTVHQLLLAVKGLRQ